MRVARAASAKAANVFESVLRSIALEVPGLELLPQVYIEEDGLAVSPDLVDVTRRLVVEAESFEFHGKRRALRADCERYTALVIRGWRVIRFAWEHVMFEPEYVRSCLEALVHLPPPVRPQRRAPPSKSARDAA